MTKISWAVNLNLFRYDFLSSIVIYLLLSTISQDLLELDDSTIALRFNGSMIGAF